MRFTTLRTLFGSDAKKNSVACRGKVRHFRPSIDLLEDRRLLAVITVDDNHPADFTTIQDAVDNANPGDTIKVRPGTYAGNVEVDVARLTILGRQPFDVSDTGPSIVEDDDYGFSL